MYLFLSTGLTEDYLDTCHDFFEYFEEVIFQSKEYIKPKYRKMLRDLEIMISKWANVYPNEFRDLVFPALKVEPGHQLRYTAD